jgi:hypothetical protein
MLSNQQEKHELHGYSRKFGRKRARAHAGYAILTRKGEEGLVPHLRVVAVLTKLDVAEMQDCRDNLEDLLLIGFAQVHHSHGMLNK